MIESEPIRLDCELSGQSVHVGLSIVELYVPGVQSVQAPPVPKAPALHLQLLTSTLVVVVEDEKSGQLVQAWTPVDALNLPASQAIHCGEVSTTAESAEATLILFPTSLCSSELSVRSKANMPAIEPENASA